ncbi:uncharacterized protein BX664DRAFT_326260 [Halteromyces radiatus]|uniref:uncharacterized protein n=1 Tax=Halteromyces radiatus TaxID=101107 RepID=UPI00221F9439|nr:uncharacterized protein BX664DRAFT_326260 [Halteromyces radiatus]KAI8097389.1 hypothetical protein BX664DRAFT_326260 [Halteromyces radiatus]
MAEKRQTKAMQERHERILNELLKIPGNEYCADCRSRNPRWASYSLGVFLCVRCAGIHRKMGTHISRIKSLSMDQWTPEQIEAIKNSGGNIKVNNIVNPNPTKYPLPLADDEGHAMEKYIRNKWEKRAFMENPTMTSSLALTNGIQQQQKHRNVPIRSSSVPVISKENDGMALIKLHEMGFKDDYKNQAVLRQTQGNLNAAIEILSRYNTNHQQRDTQDNLTDDQKLVQLRNMGYTDMIANRDALRRTGGNVDVAVTLLKGNQASNTPVTNASIFGNSSSSNSMNQQSMMTGGNVQQQQQQQQLLDLSDTPPIQNYTTNNSAIQFQQHQQTSFLPPPQQQPIQQQMFQQQPLQQQPLQQLYTSQPQQQFIMQPQQQGQQQVASPFSISNAMDPFGQNTAAVPAKSTSLQTTQTSGFYPSNMNGSGNLNNSNLIPQVTGMPFQQSHGLQTSSNPFSNTSQIMIPHQQQIQQTTDMIASTPFMTSFSHQQPQPQSQPQQSQSQQQLQQLQQQQQQQQYQQMQPQAFNRFPNFQQNQQITRSSFF